MNQNSIAFIRQHWKLLYHPSAGDFAPLIERTVLQSLLSVIKELEGSDWRSLSELSESTGISTPTLTQITNALEGVLFEKFQHPEPGRGREVVVRVLKKRKK